MTRSDKIKAEENFTVSEQGFTIGKILGKTERSTSIGMHLV